MSTGSARAGYLFLSLLQARTGASLMRRLGDVSPAEVPAMPAAEASERLRLTDRASGIFRTLSREFEAGTVLAELADKGLYAVTLDDGGYPERLRQTSDPPPALFVKGELPAAPVVALVGSRKASVTGLENARSVGRALGERGVCVTSGLALGIDAAAHEGALEGGGPVAGVLGCGIDVIYPRSNRSLYERVARSGTIVSEYYLGEAPLQWRFPARNRVISGLSEVVVVVEAAERSGALITARHALDGGREVWAVPGPLNSPECRGSNRLLGDGAGVLWDIPEFVEAVAPRQEKLVTPDAGGPASSGAVSQELPEKEAAVLAGVGFESTQADVISRRSRLQMREVLSALALLELKGYVARDAAGAFVRRGR